MSIVVDKGTITITEGLSKYVFPEATYYIDGLIYAYGKKAGNETVEWMNSVYQKTGRFPFNELRGAFSCFVKFSSYIVAFSDNSNMHCVYYSDYCFSSSFLSILDKMRKNQVQLTFDSDAVCEYLTMGRIIFDKTFFNEIHLLPTNCYLEMTEGGNRVISKEIGDNASASTLASMSEFFEKLSYSLSDQKICQALTGGYDSRLVYACLLQHIEDHPAISANIETASDVVCAKQVAQASGNELEIIHIEKPVYSDELIEEIFRESDGFQPLNIDTWIRLKEFRRSLASRFDIHLTGDGGVLHKDWEWMQELPFYRKKKSNAKKFYHQRLYFLKKKYLGSRLKEIMQNQEPRIVKELEKLKKVINTESIDTCYYYVSGNRRAYYNINPVKDFISYGPLNELDLVRYSYALPRRKRFFYYSMRKETTRANPKLARIKTCYGMTESNEIPFILRDVFFQTIDYMKKALRLMSRIILRKNRIGVSVLDWSLKDDLANSKLLNRALEYTQAEGFVDSAINIESLDFSEMQRIVHLYLLSEKTMYVEAKKM